MFVLAILIGIYAYIIFLLGICSLLNPTLIIVITVIYWLTSLFWKSKNLLHLFAKIRKVKRKTKKLVILFTFLFFLQAVVNLIGALGPELGFDALWYHLTLPKLFLLHHEIYYISGGLLYYSVMPKLAEMLYVAGLSFGNEITVKLIHFSFGLLTCLALYQLQRKFFSPLLSFVGVVIFYSNLVVAWESITAYIDLIRTFYEVMALWGFVNWWESQKRKWLLLSAFMVGFAITTKLLAVSSLGIFLLFIIFKLRRRKEWINNVAIFFSVSLVIPLPWLLFSYIHTGNPVYPFFTSLYDVSPESLNIITFLKEVWVLFTQAPDPITPIYFIFSPLIVWLFPRMKKNIKLVSLYSFCAIIIWYFTPRTGGGRFILPYLPAFSMLCGYVLSQVFKKLQFRYIWNFLLVIIIFVSTISIGYRLVANAKYISVIVGKETKQIFLTDHLNFGFGDFYDTDNYFKKNISATDKVLLFGFHNLYYVDFPFIDSSWLQSNDKFNYIATQKIILPPEFRDWVLIYENDKTMVKLYKQPEKFYTKK